MSGIAHIKAVLERRLMAVNKALERNPDMEYLQGKRDGYEQAIELMKESDQSINVEI